MRSVRLGVRTPGFHPGNRGSIPLRTAIKSLDQWSVRLGVRTPGFHPGNRGSIPLRTAKPWHTLSGFFYAVNIESQEIKHCL